VNVVNFYKEAVGELLRLKQEIFMPLVYRVEEEQVDFGYALAKIFIPSDARPWLDLP
jgi:hypothetical protein